MTASTITDLYRGAGRITRATVGHDSAGMGEVYVFEFEDGRWLEVIGGSTGWPMDERDQKERGR
jgi:hypothetical protein